MASQPIPLPTAATPIERILSRFDRQQVADFIEVAISLLDVANDPDLEDDDPAEDADAPEDSDPDRCPAQEDIGTDHDATRKMGWDSSWEDEDTEDGADREQTDDGAEPPAPLTLNEDGASWLD